MKDWTTHFTEKILDRHERSIYDRAMERIDQKESTEKKIRARRERVRKIIKKKRKKKGAKDLIRVFREIITQKIPQEERQRKNDEIHENIKIRAQLKAKKTSMTHEDFGMLSESEYYMIMVALEMQKKGHNKKGKAALSKNQDTLRGAMIQTGYATDIGEIIALTYMIPDDERASILKRIQNGYQIHHPRKSI